MIAFSNMAFNPSEARGLSRAHDAVTVLERFRPSAKIAKRLKTNRYQGDIAFDPATRLNGTKINNRFILERGLIVRILCMRIWKGL